MKRKGFTLVELLVVIAIIALLMGILMPALAQVRRLAQKMLCGTNLSGIGKSMMIYAQDNDEDYPIAGGNKGEWSTNGKVNQWDAELRSDAFSGNEITVTSSFYLLVRNDYATAKQFVCKGDVSIEEFKLSDFDGLDDDITVADVWDFGSDDAAGGCPGDYVSYSYHLPYRHTNTGTGSAGRFPINVSSSPSSPICADRNPYLDKNAKEYIDGEDDDEEPPEWENNNYLDEDRTGNAAAHQREGQNVLFNDIHVTFEKYPNCGIENDNIWKCWTSLPPADQEAKQLGNSPYNVLSQVGQSGYGPMSEKDAALVNEVQDGKM